MPRDSDDWCPQETSDRSSDFDPWVVRTRESGASPLPDPEAFLDDLVFSVKAFQTTQLTQLNSAHGQEGGQAPAQAVSVLQVISLRFYSLLPDDILELPKIQLDSKGVWDHH